MPPSPHGRDFLDIVLWVGYKRLAGGISTPDSRNEKEETRMTSAAIATSVRLVKDGSPLQFADIAQAVTVGGFQKHVGNHGGC